MLEQKYTWEKIEPTAAPVVSGSGLRRYLSGEKMTVAQFRFAAGTLLAEHRHENEQFSMVLDGTMEFNIEGNDGPLTVQPGEIVYLRPNILHGAKAVTDAVILDVFSPPRADWEP
ncbi:MAG: cupin domain-containing protein [Armatimonadota bacterium]